MWAWLSNLIGAKDVVKETLSGVGGLAKDIKTIVTGKMDPEKAVEVLLKVAEIELEFTKVQSQVIIAEAQGSWLQKSWRPICMFVFMILCVLDSFNILPNRLAEQAWSLLQIGLGGD